ncbi:MAG: hypothetical protein AAGH87_02415 [Pseudomonadota bacterium]
MNCARLPSGLVASVILTAGLAAPAGATVSDRAGFGVSGAVIVWSADEGGAAPTVVDFVIDTGNGATGAASGDTDLIAEDTNTVVTGTLLSTFDSPASAGTMPFRIEDAAGGDFITDSNGDGIANASDSFSAFNLTPQTGARVDATTSRSSFYVASNVPFAIDAQSQFGGPNTDLIFLFITSLDMEVTRTGDDGVPFGSKAQFPHSAGPQGGVTAFPNLLSLLPGRNVFTGNQRTAFEPGSIADQSVRFDLAYSVGAQSLQGYDMSLGTFDFEVEITYTVYIP